MGWKNSTARYGALSIALHWLMLLLIVAVYACIELRSQFPRGSDLREALKAWHFTLGLAVFVLVWLRLIARLMGPIPDIVPRPSKLQLRIAHAFEYAIYAFMIAMREMPFLYLVNKNAFVAVSPEVKSVKPSVFRPQTYWNVEELALEH